MIGGVRLSWQTAIADLALILFMVTAAAMGSQEDPPTPDNPLPAQAEPVAVFRAAAGAPPLAQWLDEQPHDPRQRLTIVGRYAPGGLDAMSREALQLAATAEAAGHPARLLLQPGSDSDLLAVLAFDRGEDWHEHCTALGTTGASRASAKDLPCE